jgi:hypothetical protein
MLREREGDTQMYVKYLTEPLADGLSSVIQSNRRKLRDFAKTNLPKDHTLWFSIGTAPDKQGLALWIVHEGKHPNFPTDSRRILTYEPVSLAGTPDDVNQRFKEFTLHFQRKNQGWKTASTESE